MDKSGFVYITKFRIDMLNFKVYRHADGRFLTETKDIESKIETEDIYDDYEQFEGVFEDELTKEELKEIKG